MVTLLTGHVLLGYGVRKGYRGPTLWDIVTRSTRSITGELSGFDSRGSGNLTARWGLRRF